MTDSILIAQMNLLDLFGLVFAFVVLWALGWLAAVAIKASQKTEDGEMKLFEQIEARVDRERQTDAAALMMLDEMERTARA